MNSFDSIFFLLGIIYVIFIFEIGETKGDKLIPTYRTVFERGIKGVEVVVDDIKGKSGPKKPTKFGDFLNKVASNFHAIYPGTEWCGSGNIAPNNNSLGEFNKTDACCRGHDNCFSNIEAGNSKPPLLNNGIFTRSNCECDHDFFNCLKKVNDPIAASIGYTYFNILRPQCFALEYPIVSCAKKDRRRIIEKKCLEYNLNMKQNKTLQWFDNPDFYNGIL